MHLFILFHAVADISEMFQNDIHANRQIGLIVCCVIWMCLSGTLVALRLFVRRTSKAGLWYDDYAIVVALLFAYGTPVGVLIGED